jgi:hypothetical protein
MQPGLNQTSVEFGRGDFHLFGWFRVVANGNTGDFDELAENLE